MQSSEGDFYLQEMEFPNLIAWKCPVYQKTKFCKKVLTQQPYLVKTETRTQETDPQNSSV